MTIPVTFTFRNVEYTGELSDVHGGGGTHHYHLMVGNWYWGRLRFANQEWFFDPTPKHPEMEHMAEYFGSVVVAYFQ
jgi:hypothetical protein